jgi:putative protease
MYGGREGRGYITRTQPDNAGVELGVVTGRLGNELVVEVGEPLAVGDGVGFEPPAGARGAGTGFSVGAVRTLGTRAGLTRQALAARATVPVGWRVVRTSHAALLARARASYAALSPAARGRRARLDVRVFGNAGGPLKAVFRSGDDEVTVQGEIALAPASKRALGEAQLRDQLGRLGETPFALGGVDARGLAPGLFVPVSELNRIRQEAVEELTLRRDWARQAELGEREARVAAAVEGVNGGPPPGFVDAGARPFALRASVFDLDDARAAAAAGATEVVLDPFLRHPAPPLARVRALADELSAGGVALRLRTPTVVRPAERRALEKWFALELPLLSGHLGLVAEFGAAGRDVLADYAVNCFNQHTAAELFALGAGGVTLSVELTADEMTQVVAPWGGRGFDAFVYGRPEGMTIEHCVLSAAFDRVPTTCRDLCVQKHPERGHHRPARVHVRGRNGLGVPQPAAPLPPGRRLRVAAAAVARRRARLPARLQRRRRPGRGRGRGLPPGARRACRGRAARRGGRACGGRGGVHPRSLRPRRLTPDAPPRACRGARRFRPPCGGAM